MFRQVKRATAGRKNFEGGIYQSSANGKLYGSRLSFYDIPPTSEITLEEFEGWAIDRLRILIEIESCVARQKLTKDIEATIKPMLLKYLPLTNNPGTMYEERRKDHYSHYILRLVFCRTDELRRKFIKNETILFKVRYNLLQPLEQQEFIENCRDKLPWNYISQQEKSDLFEQLYSATGAIIKNHLIIESGNSDLTINNDQLKQHIRMKENFIKLPFEKVSNLVSSRSVLIREGFAYVPTTLQLSLLSVEFQDGLMKSLIRTFQTLPRLDEDDRLLPLIANLSHNFSNIQYDTADYGADPSLISDINAQSITKSTINKHYPLCASRLQRDLHNNCHLKYQGRQQLGLFLKGIGLSVDEALKFWAQEFTRNGSISMEKFNKEYKYNIRHQYGLEGARINYKPWDCATILSKPRPGKTDSHGCPYRDLDPESLVNNLQQMGINDQHEINGVIDDVSKRDYTVACTRVFELTHKKQLNGSKNEEGMHINHPNLYFDRSRQLERVETKATVEV